MSITSVLELGTGHLCNHDDVYYSPAPMETKPHHLGIAPLWSAYDDSGQVYGDILYINNAEIIQVPHADTALNLAQELALQRYKMVRKKIERSRNKAFTSHFGEPDYTHATDHQETGRATRYHVGTTFQLAPYVTLCEWYL